MSDRRLPGDDRVGVGIIGAGLVTQAVHVPTVARARDKLKVVAISSRHGETAEIVAGRVGARAATGVDQVLSDPAVEVVAVCSPNAQHSEHVIAACEAGKPVVFCEKPLATSFEELDAIEDAVQRNGVHLVVGAMLTYDPAWRLGLDHWRSASQKAAFVRSAMYLPLNPSAQTRVEDLLPLGPRPTNDLSSAEGRYAALAGAVLGLGTHALPQIHAMMPGLSIVTDARWINPWGYAITLSDGDRTAELLALMPGPWETDWTFEAWSEEASLLLDSPPAFVQAGSSRAVYKRGPEQATWSSQVNGYDMQWSHLADLARGGDPIIEQSDVLAETRLALSIIEGARPFFKVA